MSAQKVKSENALAQLAALAGRFEVPHAQGHNSQPQSSEPASELLSTTKNLKM